MTRLPNTFPLDVLIICVTNFIKNKSLNTPIYQLLYELDMSKSNFSHTWKKYRSELNDLGLHLIYHKSVYGRKSIHINVYKLDELLNEVRKLEVEQCED